MAQQITYCFTTGDGKCTVEREFPRGKAPEFILISLRDGGSGDLADTERAFRDYRAELAPTHSTGAGWPMPPCYASGVQPEQREVLQDYLAHKGVPTEVSPQGDPIYRDSTHRKAALKARGMHDRASF